MEDTRSTQLALVVVGHRVGVAKIHQILLKVDPAVPALHVRLQEDLLKELPGAALNAALVEAAVVPGNPPW